ncbi:MAG: carboxylesterase family protein [Terracidiphilus sp.]|jgi:para-nitrobenzyl esterase
MEASIFDPFPAHESDEDERPSLFEPIAMFVFDTAKVHYGAPFTQADEKVAQEMNAYWANFVKTGNPNGAGLPEWPTYDSTSDMLMDFTNDGPLAKADPWKKRLDLTKQLASQQTNR